MKLVVGLVLSLILHSGAVQAESIILQSTTSTQNSGLLDFILPQFTAKTGIEVRVVAVGTGQALKNAANGDGDVVLVHARDLEDAFVAEGWGVGRRDVMYNDFIIVGPDEDPAHVAEAPDAVAAFKAISAGEFTFVSRGDDSGTHIMERAIWAHAVVDPLPDSGDWYLESGTGMGATLNISVETDAYTLTDRGTWISFGNKQDHRLLFEGDPELFNPYGIMLVNPERYPFVKQAAGQSLIDWMTSDEGQAAIAAYRVDGQQLFFPSAK